MMMIKTKAGFLARALGVMAAAIIAAGAPLAAGAAGGHGGGGGGGHGGGGGGHFSGGGGHFSGGAHFSGAAGRFSAGGAHFSGGGGHFATGGARFMGGFHGGGAVQFQPRSGFVARTPHFAASTGGHSVGGHVSGGFAGGRVVTPSYTAHPSASFGRPAFHGGHSGFAGHPGYVSPGFHRHGYVGGAGRFWGGGYWGGRFWPGVHYGPHFVWFYPVLPFGFSTYWWGATPYYYYDNAYYLWDPSYNGYVATDPPPVSDTDESGSSVTEDGVQSNDVGTGGGAADIYVYPRNGQSDEQTSNDRFECHKWAVSQTGFDPTRSTNTQGTVDDYRRAIGACLDARGYTVK